jgi:predicted transcriptional regulator
MIANEALRAAIREGAADADAGRFADDYSLPRLIAELNAESNG